MTLKIISSNSSGNAYLLQSATGTLLIECGVHISKIKQALNYNITNVACIVSHSHGDHACSIKAVMDAGINVFASAATFMVHHADKHHRAKVIYDQKNFLVNGFKIKPFSVHHDVPCFGFMISHEEMGNCIFLTDTFYCDYTFPGTHQYIIECNHDQEIIYDNKTPGFLRERVIQSHMNIETCKGLLSANDLRQVNNIVLIHLSNTNSNALQFKKEIETLTGKNVFVADAGMVIENFNKEPF